MKVESPTAVSPDSILNSMSSGILAVDTESRVAFVNAALARRIGKTASQCHEMEANQLFSHMTADIPLSQTPLYRLGGLVKSARVQSREVQCASDTGVMYLREDSSPLQNASGEIVGRLFAYHDLSWEKTIDRMKSDFISI